MVVVSTLYGIFSLSY